MGRPQKKDVERSGYTEEGWKGSKRKKKTKRNKGGKRKKGKEGRKKGINKKLYNGLER
jgi:hypothetical protein